MAFLNKPDPAKAYTPVGVVASQGSPAQQPQVPVPPLAPQQAAVTDPVVQPQTPQAASSPQHAAATQPDDDSERRKRTPRSTPYIPPDETPPKKPWWNRN